MKRGRSAPIAIKSVIREYVTCAVCDGKGRVHVEGELKFPEPQGPCPQCLGTTRGRPDMALVVEALMTRGLWPASGSASRCFDVSASIPPLPGPNATSIDVPRHGFDFRCGRVATGERAVQLSRGATSLLATFELEDEATRYPVEAQRALSALARIWPEPRNAADLLAWVSLGAETIARAEAIVCELSCERSLPCERVVWHVGPLPYCYAVCDELVEDDTRVVGFAHGWDDVTGSVGVACPRFDGR